jgi:uncharacterized surface protein with fasciclin (FAS1) repeats
MASIVLPLSAPSAASANTEQGISRSIYACVSQKIVRGDGDIVDIAISNPAFSTLVVAVKAAGLVQTLKGPGPFTVFAPTDAAFNGLPSFLLNAALSDPQGLLTSILTYHVASGIYDPRFAFVPREISTVLGQGLFLSSNRRGVGVNQSNVSCQGIRADNGIIWVIDSVLLPQFPAAK